MTEVAGFGLSSEAPWNPLGLPILPPFPPGARVLYRGKALDGVVAPGDVATVTAVHYGTADHIGLNPVHGASVLSLGGQVIGVLTRVDRFLRDWRCLG